MFNKDGYIIPEKKLQQYKSTPAKEWQGLSEEEFIYFTSFVNAETLSEIEKTFREKNYGKI